MPPSIVERDILKISNFSVWPGAVLGVGFSLALAGCSLVPPAGTSAGSSTVSADISEDPAPVALAQTGQSTATFAGGCFWSMDAIFNQLKGVISAQPGYAGGATVNPNYRDVASGSTDYAETINVIYDPKIISYADLLNVFLTVHNPTQLNRQGNDIGTQYRSEIFTRTPEEQRLARQALAKPASDYGWQGTIVTQLAPLEHFYRAEDTHLDYYNRNPTNGYGLTVVSPEVRHFRSKFGDRLKN